MSDREVKYRAFCLNDELMYYDVQNGIDFVDDSHYRFDEFIEKKQSNDYHDWKLMQFTGCKDKNKKDIYEGDILYYAGTIDVPHVVSFIEGAFYSCYMEKKTLIGKPEFCIVMGNIYEDSHLFDQEDETV